MALEQALLLPANKKFLPIPLGFPVQKAACSVSRALQEVRGLPGAGVNPSSSEVRQRLWAYMRVQKDRPHRGSSSGDVTGAAEVKAAPLQRCCALYRLLQPGHQWRSG